MDVAMLSLAAALVLGLAVYALVRAAGRLGDRLQSACPRCRGLNIYQHARANGRPGWKCKEPGCGWEWPQT